MCLRVRTVPSPGAQSPPLARVQGPPGSALRWGDAGIPWRLRLLSIPSWTSAERDPNPRPRRCGFLQLGRPAPRAQRGRETEIRSVLPCPVLSPEFRRPPPRLQVTVPAGAKAGGAFPARGTRRGACSSCVPPPSLLGTQAPSRAPRGPFPGTSEGSPRPRLGALHRRPGPTPRAPSRPGSGSHLSACPLLQQPPPDTPPPPVTAPSPAPAVFTRGGRGEAGRARGSANQRRWGGGEGREGGAATRFWCGRAAVCSRRGTSPWDWQAWPGTREGSAPRQSGVGGSAGNAGRFPEPRSARSLLTRTDDVSLPSTGLVCLLLLCLVKPYTFLGSAQMSRPWLNISTSSSCSATATPANGSLNQTSLRSKPLHGQWLDYPWFQVISSRMGVVSDLLHLVGPFAHAGAQSPGTRNGLQPGSLPRDGHGCGSTLALHSPPVLASTAVTVIQGPVSRR
nr:translation initiation factor IF-2-like [Manis javanica]